MIEHKLFPTFVGEFDLRSKVNPQLLYNELVKIETKEHSLLEGDAKSSYDLNKEFLLDTDVPLIAKLKTAIQESINEYVERIGLLPTTISNSWYSIMNKGSSLKFHRHEASVISGAYYPKVPDGSVGLSFASPLEIYRMAELHNQITEYNCAEVSVPAQEGFLYIFPSWLKHGSGVNKVDNRMVVSFNTLNIPGEKH
jgi:uncharacterized protein (TIGR02466 family)